MIYHSFFVRLSFVFFLMACGSNSQEDTVAKINIPDFDPPGGPCVDLRPYEECKALSEENEGIVKFWNSFHSNDLENLDKTIKEMEAEFDKYPANGDLAKYLGFANTWYFAEFQRRGVEIDSTFLNAISNMRKFFQASIDINGDIRSQSFLYANNFALAKLDEDEQTALANAKKLDELMVIWPEWANFAGLGPYGLYPENTKEFSRSLDLIWEEVELCIGERIDRKNPMPQLKKFKDEKRTGRSRVCSSSWIAPHSFEGFFLTLGDLLVKNNDFGVAKNIYEHAKTAENYQKWDQKFKDILSDRIARMEHHRDNFRKPMIEQEEPKFAPVMEYGCTVCHQK